MNAPTCSSTRRDGTPCRATPTASGRCFAHDAALQESTSNGRRRGGQNKSNARRAAKRMPRELRDIVDIVEAAMGAVLQSKVSPSQGHAVASLAGAWVRLHELGEVQQRLEALEQAAESRKGWRA